MSHDQLKEKLFTVAFMATVTAVAITVLAGVQIVTQPAVNRNRTLFQKQAVYDAFGLERPDTNDELLAWYDRKVVEVSDAEGELDHFWIRDQQGKQDSLVLIQRGAGLWGTITAFVGFDLAPLAIRGVTFTDHVETPGLGARIDESWFRQQFRGKRGPFHGLRSERDPSPPEDHKFDQITGATVTSTAVKGIMNHSLEKAKRLVEAK